MGLVRAAMAAVHLTVAAVLFLPLPSAGERADVALAGGIPAGEDPGAGDPAAEVEERVGTDDSLFSPLKVPLPALPVRVDDGTWGPPPEPLYLVLNVAARRLYVYRDGGLIRVYPTTVGRPGEPTPVGLFSIRGKTINPTWYPPERPPVPPGPENPLGTRWMGFSPWGHGLHGTNTPWLIGLPVSRGCVRLHNEDAEELFEMVRIGTPVLVVYQPVELAVYPPEEDGEAEEGAEGRPGEEEEEPGRDQGPAGPDETRARRFVLTLHPDIYARLGDYRAFLESRLALAGVALERTFLEWLVKAAEEHQAVTWDTATPVVVGDRPVGTGILHLGLGQGGEPLLAVRAFGEALGLAVGWDPEEGRPLLDGRPVPNAVIAAGRSYARVPDLAEAVGRELACTVETFPPADGEDLVRQRVAVTLGYRVLVNGVAVGRQAFASEYGIHVPLRPVAEALGIPVHWDAERRVVLLGGVEVQAVIIGDTSYVSVEELRDLLAGRAAVAVTRDAVLVITH
jgi:lipoprotein-anchoring transpeptidase ErfK/SrfK